MNHDVCVLDVCADEAVAKKNGVSINLYVKTTHSSSSSSVPGRMKNQDEYWVR